MMLVPAASAGGYLGLSVGHSNVKFDEGSISFGENDTAWKVFESVGGAWALIYTSFAGGSAQGGIMPRCSAVLESESAR